MNLHGMSMKCEKWTDQHDTSVGQRKSLGPRQELNPQPPEHWAGGQEVMGWTPVRDSDFFFVPCMCHVDQCLFHISLPSLKFSISIHLCQWINLPKKLLHVLCAYVSSLENVFCFKIRACKPSHPRMSL